MNTELFVQKLIEHGIDFFTGVPDSLLKNIGNCICNMTAPKQHIIAANEGNAIALAAGHYLSTGKIPLVYLQNSGLGNTVNPLLSMADPSLYAVPMLVFLGWRGQKGVNDAEQHLKQGRITCPLLETMEYSWEILEKESSQAVLQIGRVIDFLKAEPQPYFFLVEKETFEPVSLRRPPPSLSKMSRETALRIIAELLPSDYFVVSTTGKTSREWHEIREELQQDSSRDFPCIGSMGHTSSIALGMAVGSKKNILCIDGDGSMLMHLGAIAVAGKLQLENFHYLLLNNGSHESVGGLPTPLDHVNFERFFLSLGFSSCYTAENPEELRLNFEKFIHSSKSILELKIKQGSREELSRPQTTAHERSRTVRRAFSTLKE